MAKSATKKSIFDVEPLKINSKEDKEEVKEVVEPSVDAEKAPQDVPTEKVEETPVEVEKTPKTPKKTKKESVKKEAVKKEEPKSEFLKALEAKVEKKEIRNGRFQCKVKESYLKHFDEVCAKLSMSRADLLEKLIDENLR